MGARPSPRLAAAARLFAAVESSTTILHELRPHRYKIVPYLIALATHSQHWRREPEDFRASPEQSSVEVVPALVRHLFADYAAPAWLETALVPRRGRLPHAPELGWFVQVVQGRNLRDAPGLPFPLTRRAAHFALLAPARMRPVEALLFGFLHAHGGRDELVQELLLCSGRLEPRLDQVWLKLFEKIAVAPRFPLHQVRPLIDYVKHRRSRVADFRLDRYRIDELLNLTGRWHTELAAKSLPSDAPWASRLRADTLSGSSERGDYALAELLSPRALFEEGRWMRHCVATYTRACADGQMSIWSLRFRQSGCESERVTIRVETAELRVVEARRFANAKIDALDLQIIVAWASDNGLSVVDGL